MIHVNVQQVHADWHRGFEIEVSYDGAAWLAHWFLPAKGTSENDARLNAGDMARIYAAGIKLGRPNHNAVRLTAFGDERYVPDMTTSVGLGRVYAGTGVIKPLTMPKRQERTK